MERHLYRISLGFSILAALGAIGSLIPWNTSPQYNVLGYLSLCPFAPAATLFCLGLGALSCTLRAAYWSPKARNKGSLTRGILNHRPGLLLTGFLFLGGIIATVPYVRQGYDLTLSASLMVSSQGKEAPMSKVETPASFEPLAPLVSKLPNGTYPGMAQVGDVSMSLEVSVKDGQIKSITIRESKNFPPVVIQDLQARTLRAQSPWIDAISGATLSSQIWSEAVYQALGTRNP